MFSCQLGRTQSPVRDVQAIAFVASEEKHAQDDLLHLRARYPSVPLEKAQIVVVLGGDGFMLKILKQFANSKVALYGMNSGSIGFLMNEYSEESLLDRIAVAEETIIHPLVLHSYHGTQQDPKLLRAINEISLFRRSSQAAKLQISVDHKVRIPELIADGIILATPAGSTAYNFSANGPILPLNAPLLALTPLNPFRPRRWHGALLPQNAVLTVNILEAEKRPVIATADHQEVECITKIEVHLDEETSMRVLHDWNQPLQERVIREQFGNVDTYN